MKRFCIINMTGLREVELWDGQPLGCEVLAGHFGPGCFYTDRNQAEVELLRLSEQYGPIFQIFESSEKVTEKQAIIKGRGQSVFFIEAVE